MAHTMNAKLTYVIASATQFLRHVTRTSEEFKYPYKTVSDQYHM